MGRITLLTAILLLIGIVGGCRRTPQSVDENSTDFQFENGEDDWQDEQLKDDAEASSGDEHTDALTPTGGEESANSRTETEWQTPDSEGKSEKNNEEETETYNTLDTQGRTDPFLDTESSVVSDTVIATQNEESDGLDTDSAKDGDTTVTLETDSNVSKNTDTTADIGTDTETTSGFGTDTRYDAVNDSVWFDETSGLSWHMPASMIHGRWQEAIEFCEDLTLEGHSDWHLPSIDELRTLMRECPPSETGGACPMTQNSDLDDWTDACSGCGYRGDLVGYGCYWPDEFGSNSCSQMWSTKQTEGDTDFAWMVDFIIGQIGEIPARGSAEIRCVRQEELPVAQDAGPDSGF